MNILDENIFASQRDILRRWRVRVVQIGQEIGRSAMSDQDIIPLLRQMRRSTLFTLDRDFYRRRLCHERYCLVWLDIPPLRAAEFVRRVLRHPQFDTQGKRMGSVVAVRPPGLRVWRPHAEQETSVPWPPRGRT